MQSYTVRAELSNMLMAAGAITQNIAKISARIYINVEQRLFCGYGTDGKNAENIHCRLYGYITARFFRVGLHLLASPRAGKG